MTFEITETLFVTGSAGFIGANFVLEWVKKGGSVVSLDQLTYAGNLDNLKTLKNNPHHVFIQGDIGDQTLATQLLHDYKPRAVINFAAESHVDRSIHNPEIFFQTNVLGTLKLLESVKSYFATLGQKDREAFRFLHVSTDEVYGSLSEQDPAFTETTLYQPNSPYSASKAASDHAVRAYHHTYGLPVLTTNCSNNYGPFQFPEKLIPLMIMNALSGKTLPVYGDGQNVRDWLYVLDHCRAICRVLESGRVGETYNIGGCNEMKNLDVVHLLCDSLDKLKPLSSGKSYRDQIVFITDRPGHDRRYAIDATKIKKELAWTPEESFETGLKKTISWYLDHQEWVTSITSGAYREWIDHHYGEK